MSTVVLTAGVKFDSIADNALKAAARLWFVVAISGQLMLAVYVALFYGGTALQGHVETWNRVLTRGYIRGDAVGNLAMLVHLFGAVMLIAGGAILFIPQVRERVPLLHRWTGRIYLLTACAAALTGLYLTWIRGTRGDLTQHIGGSLNAVLIILCAVFALRSALARRFTAHRVWVLRLYLLVSAAWFYRVGLFLWLLLNHGPVGFDVKTFQGPTLTFLSFANSVVPIVVLELYLRAQAHAGAHGRLVMAAVLFVLTVAMGLGIFSATMGMWLPLIRTGSMSLTY
ncbi:MAG TPA: DUF2306 domain-containing protein [Thermoanaerobaculia bacterium]|nr:DUF2306 domain-containing protein [Thermoanaerobaculia bacterium]